MILSCNMTPYTTTEPAPSSLPPTPDKAKTEGETGGGDGTEKEREGVEKSYGKLEMPKQVKKDALRICYLLAFKCQG